MNRLKQLRKEKSLTLSDISKLTGINHGTYNNYENGKTNPTSKTWQQLAVFFGVSVPYLQGACSREKIAKIIQQKYRKGLENKRKVDRHIVFLITDCYQWLTTIDNYLISVGAVPYNIPKENAFLSDKQVDDLNFWLKYLEPAFEQVPAQWLLTKPELNATEQDIEQAMYSVLVSITDRSSIPFDFLQQDGKWRDQYFAKRKEYLKNHTFYKQEKTKTGRQVLIHYYDFSRENPTK